VTTRDITGAGSNSAAARSPRTRRRQSKALRRDSPPCGGCALRPQAWTRRAAWRGLTAQFVPPQSVSAKWRTVPAPLGEMCDRCEAVRSALELGGTSDRQRRDLMASACSSFSPFVQGRPSSSHRMAGVNHPPMAVVSGRPHRRRAVADGDGRGVLPSLLPKPVGAPRGAEPLGPSKPLSAVTPSVHRDPAE
jgi:hypothetical protein